MKEVTGKGDVWLVYDGECPVCNTYCMHARIRDAVGRLHLVDARQPSALMDEITAAGLDIDQGMVVKFQDVLYYGPEAIRMLTLLSSPYGTAMRAIGAWRWMYQPFCSRSARKASVIRSAVR